MVHTSVLDSRGTLLMLGLLGQRSRSRGSNVPKLFPIYNPRMPWPTFLKLGPHIRAGQQRNPIDFGVTGSKVKVTRSNVSKLFQIVELTISQNEFLLHTFVQLILNWLIQFYKTYVTKISLEGITFYKLLVLS